MNTRIFVMLVLAVALAACQKNLFEYAGAGEPKDAPQYSVNASLNGKVEPKK